jgi:hypothetical protein
MKGAKMEKCMGIRKGAQGEFLYPPLFAITLRERKFKKKTITQWEDS